VQNEKLYLVLGCFGRRDDDFVNCLGVENRILRLNDSLEYYSEIMDYFESLRLFDKPLFDYNAIRHVVYNMQDRYDQKFKRLWTEKYYNLLERFIVGHRSCGIYMKLVLVNTDYEEPPAPPVPESIKVKKTEGLDQVARPPDLKVIRGRR
jgi:hypothetical protein